MVADRHVNAEDIGAARVRSKVAPRRALVIFSNMMDPFYNFEIAFYNKKFG